MAKLRKKVRLFFVIESQDNLYLSFATTERGFNVIVCVLFFWQKKLNYGMCF